MKMINKTCLLILLLFSVYACDDVLEEDITNDNIQIASPVEGLVIEGNSVQFSWQNLDGASNYRIQITKSNQVFEVDSLVATNTFLYTLDPGNYQWRVRAENFAYETAYTFPISFSTQASLDLTNQNVELLLPSLDFYTNEINTNFSWRNLPSATSYNFELVKKLGGEELLFEEADIVSRNLTVDASLFDEDAEYIWRVSAVNDSTKTNFSESSVFLDRVKPNVPSLTLPANEETTTVGTVVVFNWTNGTDPGNIKSAITNTVEIGLDMNFNTKLDPQISSTTTLRYEFTEPGTYYWRVIAEDAAGNFNDPSVDRLIIVE